MKDQNTPTNTLNPIVIELQRIFDQFNDGELIDQPLSQGEAIHRIESLISQAVNKAELACAVYMEPGRFQDYKNRRDGTFQNDPRLNRDETPNQVEGK